MAKGKAKAEEEATEDGTPPQWKEYEAQLLARAQGLKQHELASTVEEPDVSGVQELEELFRQLRETKIQTARILEAIIAKLAAAIVDEDAGSKQKVAKIINAYCRNNGFALANPDTGEASWLIGINDEWGGKYVLENRTTKKRSHTSRQLKALLPLKVVPLGDADKTA
jgi:hypothetical protein